MSVKTVLQGLIDGNLAISQDGVFGSKPKHMDFGEFGRVHFGHADVLEGQYVQDVIETLKKTKPQRAPIPMYDGSTNQPSVGQALASMVKRWVLPPQSDDFKNTTHYGQPWQAPGIAERVKDFLGRGETVLDLIARSGITLYEIRTLSKLELRDRIDAGAVRRSQEPRAPMVIVIDNSGK